MVTVYTEVEVDVELDDIDTDDLIEELEKRNRGLDVVSETGTQILEQIFQLRRQGYDYQQELDKLIWVALGRVV